MLKAWLPSCRPTQFLNFELTRQGLLSGPSCFVYISSLTQLMLQCWLPSTDKTNFALTGQGLLSASALHVYKCEFLLNRCSNVSCLRANPQKSLYYVVTCQGLLSDPACRLRIPSKVSSQLMLQSSFFFDLALVEAEEASPEAAVEAAAWELVLLSRAGSATAVEEALLAESRKVKAASWS